MDHRLNFWEKNIISPEDHFKLVQTITDADILNIFGMKAMLVRSKNHRLGLNVNLGKEREFQNENSERIR